ncbi:MAG: response regulator [Streptosporangiales bacterium]|nr:response regulator [Streptosporangiales bacterium]
MSAAEKPIRVLLADDQTLVRAGFRSLLERAEDIEVVAEAADGAEALEEVRSRRVDVALMDIRMPTMDGLEATRHIVGDPRFGHVRVIILTTFDIDEYVFEALRIGASGFLAKDVEPEELRRAVRVVAAGEALLSPGVTRRVIAEFTARGVRPREHAERLDALTEREREVVKLVAAGLDNREIGQRLFMSPLTAKTHVSRAIAKLGVRDRVQLVVLAYQTGLVTP